MDRIEIPANHWKSRAEFHESLREQPKQLEATDSELLDWLQEQVVDTIYLDDGRLIDVRGGDLRKAILTIRVKGAK